MTLVASVRRTLSRVPVLMGGTVTVERLTSRPGITPMTFAAGESITGRLADVAFGEQVTDSGAVVRKDTAVLRVPYQNAAGDVITALKHGDRITADAATWVVIGRIGGAASSVIPYLVERESLRQVNPRGNGA